MIFVRDAFSRTLVRWNVTTPPKSELAAHALDSATLQPGELIHHSNSNNLCAKSWPYNEHSVLVEQTQHQIHSSAIEVTSHYNVEALIAILFKVLLTHTTPSRLYLVVGFSMLGSETTSWILQVIFISAPGKARSACGLIAWVLKGRKACQRGINLRIFLSARCSRWSVVITYKSLSPRDKKICHLIKAIALFVRARSRRIPILGSKWWTIPK